MNKFCINCGSQLSNGACPKCSASKNNNNKFWLGFFAGVLVIVLIYGWFITPTEDDETTDNCLASQEQSEQTQQVEQNNGKCYATIDKFNAIQTDMTYQEVVNIVGCDGELTLESGDDSYKLRYYTWRAKRGIGNMVIGFENDYVAAKTQFGLQ